jgi:hypothetical protein
VVGDVHGCLDELVELLEALRYVKGDDRLVLLGDLLDRGPDPIGTLRFVRALGAECVLGNHEEKHLRYAAQEGRRPLPSDPGRRNGVNGSAHRRPSWLHRGRVRLSPAHAAQHAELSDEDLAWLASLPRAIRVGPGWLAVHGGLLAGRSLTAQPPDWLVRLRFVDAHGKPVHRARGEAGEEGVRRWAELWTGPESVVYGHHAREEVVVDAPRPGVRCIGIDTGCVYGGKLTALVLPGAEIVQVSSRAARAVRGADAED